MERPDIESILIANCYLLQCKFGETCREKAEVARRFLCRKIRKALEKKPGEAQPIIPKADTK